MTETQPKTPDILIVDDTPANLHLLAVMLKEHGYRVRPVPSGKLALLAIRQEPPDLILLDINMPEMNGYEVCEQLKASEMWKDIPVLFISALDEALDKIKAFAVGGVDYVTKPFQCEEVEARVQTHLNLRRLQVDLERQNRKLQENYDQLWELEELRDNMTHMVVHDMRGPLMGVTGYLEILEEIAGDKLGSEELAMLMDARSSGLALVGMVNSLLDVNRLEQGEMPLHVAVSDMDALVQEAIGTLGSLARPPVLRYQKPSPPVMVSCDADLIVRVIANLVGNAMKFTPKDGAVTISVENKDGGAMFRVTDTGVGISDEYHGKIFEKFGQVESRQQRKTGSTGLGLTFCKLAVEAHGGEIGVESEPGAGSSFWFTLPAGGQEG